MQGPHNWIVTTSCLWTARLTLHTFFKWSSMGWLEGPPILSLFTCSHQLVTVCTLMMVLHLPQAIPFLDGLYPLLSFNSYCPLHPGPWLFSPFQFKENKTRKQTLNVSLESTDFILFLGPPCPFHIYMFLLDMTLSFSDSGCQAPSLTSPFTGLHKQLAWKTISWMMCTGVSD